MYKFKRGRRKVTTLPEISLTPLIDTALTLLVIFMVTAPMMNNALKIELPKGQAKEDQGTQQDLIVSVDKNKKLYLNDKLVASNDALIKKIRSTLGKNMDRTVYVQADQSVPYGHVIELVDHIKVVGGVAYVALATKRA